MKRVENRVAVVTGGADGIGKATCLMLAREGAKVAVTDIQDAGGSQVAGEIENSGGTARFWHLDVGDEQQVAAVFAEIVGAFGEIGILVNNAGIAGANKPTHELTEEEWDRVQRTNVKGVFFCTKYAVPSLKRGGGGSIINLSSIYGVVGGPDVPPYHASKGAVRLMSKTDALLYAADGIRVNSVHPGYIWTPMVEHHLERSGIDLEQGRKDLAALHPLGRVGRPEEIASGILFLASQESSFITGSELVIDGGYTAR